MTAKKWAELAFHDAQTQALAGNDTRAFAIASQALAVIARYGNQIPPAVQYVGRDGGSVVALFQASCAGGSADSDAHRQDGSGYLGPSVIAPTRTTPDSSCKAAQAGAIPAHQQPNTEGAVI